PIQYPCYYGIDMATRAELIASNKTVDEIRAKVGATSLHYLTLEGLQDSTGLPKSQFCRACFDGDYPIAVPEEYAMCKMRFEKGSSAAACES
ncbi:MAG: amidophosphoribosyltransferase, partial [Actinobacteria bacterium]|nr:amidophosphoribosyltransferase [Actinomycetota bacterium]